MNEKTKSILLSKSKIIEVDGERRVTFVASTKSVDREYEVVQVETFRLPLKGGGFTIVGSIPEGGIENVDVPLLTDHNMYEVAKTIGSVRKASFENGQLIFECGISSRDYAQDVFKLIEEGHLDNAFSIRFRDYDYNFDTETNSNGEIIEVSLVTRGANQDARVLAVKGLTKGKDMEGEGNKAPIENEETKTETNTETETKDKSLSTQDEVAKSMVQVPKQKATSTPKAEDYLKTKGAMRDYAKVLFDNAGEDSEKVKAAWAKHLKSKGITNPDILLPQAMIQRIEDAFENAGELWPLLNKTGLTVRRVARDTNTSATGRAKGHTRGQDKSEQEITLADRTIRAQYIFKYLTLNKEDIRENQDTGALVEYVLRELPNRVIWEIERAVVIGDGREDTDEEAITSFLSIKEDAASTDGYAVTYTPVAGELITDTIVKADALVTAAGARYLIISRANLANIKIAKDGNGGYVFPFGSNVAESMSFAGIITPEWLNATNDASNQAYILVPSAYDTVGDNTPEAFSNFLLKSNKQEFLEEIYAGGALVKRASAVAIANTPAA